MLYDVVIIGGGPAGLSAGIYAGRAGLSTLIIEKYFAGGQAGQTYEIENYPGFVKVGGFELTQEMQKQATACGAQIIFEEIQSISLENKKIELKNGNQIDAKTIIIASGASHTPLGVDKEEELKGAGVSYCATCDGAFFKGKSVAVVGGGNTAVGDALYLTRFAKEVYIIHRRNEFRASPALTSRLHESGVIIKTPCTVKSLEEKEGKLCAIVIESKEGKEERLEASGLFVAVGQTPETSIFEGVDKDSKGYVITDEDMKTNLDGVFCAGDCRAKFLRQIVTACADGAIAAEQAVAYVTINNK